MADTPGCCALIVGVSNDQLIGTDLDAEWLRHRLWALSGKALTVDIATHKVSDRRILVMRSPQALESIRVNGRIRWRVGTNCVEIDAHTWHARRMADLNDDWSSEESTVPVEAARPLALELARELRRASAEERSEELAADTDRSLLRRLNVVSPMCLGDAVPDSPRIPHDKVTKWRSTAIRPCWRAIVTAERRASTPLSRTGEDPLLSGPRCLAGGDLLVLGRIGVACHPEGTTPARR